VISGTDQQIGAVNGFLQEAGIRLTRNQGDLQQDFYGRWAAKGDFKGVALAIIATGTTTEDDAYLRTYFTGGAANPSARNSSALDDPKLNGLIDTFRREFDTNKRRDVAWDIQRYISDNMWVVPVAAQSTSNLSFTHPWLMNFRVFRQTPDSFITNWIDQTKKKA
jgi:ABC-type transport system substrate-binding protein